MRAVYHFERTLYARFGLGYQEICLLQLLRRKSGIRVSEAARVLEIPLFSSTRLVQRLESDGYVLKRQDADDGRAILLSLTPKGRRLIRRIEDDNYELIMENAASFSGKELDALVLFAGKMGRLLGVEGSASEGLDQPR
jgi:DNA-binding MarR family transcriptional regulator